MNRSRYNESRYRIEACNQKLRGKTDQCPFRDRKEPPLEVGGPRGDTEIGSDRFGYRAGRTEYASREPVGALKGDRNGQHSIRINDQWRICFRWEADGVYDVEIVDYHK